MISTIEDKQKDQRLRRIYRISLEEQDAMRKYQNNKCAICRRSFDEFMAFQDHDHACCSRKMREYCGKCNRGLLCFLCNKKAIGAVEKFKKWGIELDEIIRYLAYWGDVLKKRGAYEEKGKAKKSPKKQKSV